LERAGAVVGSHTHDHPLLPQLDEPSLYAEIRRSTECLESWLGHAPLEIAYPNGSVTPRVAQVARELGYRLGLTTRAGHVETDTDPMLLPRVDISEERLAGADGRFSYDRFRFEIARVG